MVQFGDIRILLCIALSLMLAGCGFTLRGPSELPFDSIHINQSPNSEFGAQLRRQLRAEVPRTTIVEDPALAEARLQILENSRDRMEVALNAEGRVQEYDLTLRIVFQVLDVLGNAIVPPTTLTTTRTLAYDDNVAQAKEAEAQALYASMQKDIVSRILRRIEATDTREAAQRSRREAAESDLSVAR